LTPLGAAPRGPRGRGPRFPGGADGFFAPCAPGGAPDVGLAIAPGGAPDVGRGEGLSAGEASALLSDAVIFLDPRFFFFPFIRSSAEEGWCIPVEVRRQVPGFFFFFLNYYIDIIPEYSIDI